MDILEILRRVKIFISRPGKVLEMNTVLIIGEMSVVNIYIFSYAEI